MSVKDVEDEEEAAGRERGRRPKQNIRSRGTGSGEEAAVRIQKQ